MLVCSLSGLPCRYPVLCTVCGAVYEESTARTHLGSGGRCVSGHDFASEPFLAVKNGSVHSEESLEKVRLASLTGVLDYFSSLVSSLASDNFELRKELEIARIQQNGSASGQAVAVVPCLQAEGPQCPEACGDANVLQAIQRHSPQLAALRGIVPMPARIHTDPASVATLVVKLERKMCMYMSDYPFFSQLVADKSRFSVSAHVKELWPVYQEVHINSSQLSVKYVAVLCQMTITLDGVCYSPEETMLLFTPANYTHSVQQPEGTFHLADILTHLDLDAAPFALVSRYSVLHVHPYGVCLYACDDHGALVVAPLKVYSLATIDRLQLTISAGVISLLLVHPRASHAFSPPLFIKYKGEAVSIHPDGQLLASYSGSDHSLLISDICQLAYRFGPVLQYDLGAFRPVSMEWDHTGRILTLSSNNQCTPKLTLQLHKGVITSL